jgi:hypothetical protein
MFYWSDDPVLSSDWHAKTVAGKSTTYSAPSIAETSSSANITAVGSSDSLMFYWAANTSSTWQAEQVAPAGSVR